MFVKVKDRTTETDITKYKNQIHLLESKILNTCKIEVLQTTDITNEIV